MKKVAIIFFFLACFTLNNSLQAQQLFRAGFVGGFNFTQIDGDDVAGFDKIGLNTGFLVEIGLDEYERWSAVMEILYSQKGSRSTITNFFIDFKISMDYAEIPLYIRYHDWTGGLTFGAGALIGRSVKSKFVESGIDQTDSYFGGEFPPKKWELGFLVDVSYMFSPTFGLNFRYTNSITAIRSNCDSSLLPGQCLQQRHKTLALRTIIMLAGSE